MKTIWKYPFGVTDNQEIMLPRGAEILTVQIQFGRPCFWALVEQTNLLEPVRVAIFGTGEILDTRDLAALKYVGSFQLGSFVGHVWAGAG